MDLLKGDGQKKSTNYSLLFLFHILFNYLFVDISPHEHQAHVDFYTNWHF